MNFDILIEAFGDAIAKVPGMVIAVGSGLFINPFVQGQRETWDCLVGNIRQSKEETRMNYLSRRYQGGYATKDEICEHADNLIKTDELTGLTIKIKAEVETFEEALRYFTVVKEKGETISQEDIVGYLNVRHPKEFEKYSKLMKGEAA